MGEKKMKKILTAVALILVMSLSTSAYALNYALWFDGDNDYVVRIEVPSYYPIFNRTITTAMFSTSRSDYNPPWLENINVGVRYKLGESLGVWFEAKDDISHGLPFRCKTAADCLKPKSRCDSYTKPSRCLHDGYGVGRSCTRDSDCKLSATITPALAPPETPTLFQEFGWPVVIALLAIILAALYVGKISERKRR